MTAILTDADGRRCDSSCHNAKRSHCECICQGAFHSLSYDVAFAKLADEQEDWENEGFVVNLDPPTPKREVKLADLFS